MLNTVCMEEQHFTLFKMNSRQKSAHSECLCLGVVKINGDSTFSFPMFVSCTLHIFMAVSAEPRKVQKLPPSYGSFLAACYKQNELPCDKISLKTGFKRPANLIKST